MPGRRGGKNFGRPHPRDVEGDRERAGPASEGDGMAAQRIDRDVVAPRRQVDVADGFAALRQHQDAETSVGPPAGREEDHVARREPFRGARRKAERHRRARSGEERPPVNRRRAH